MESIAIVLLALVLGGGALFVGLIFAIVTGSARSERLRRIEQDQAALQRAHAEAVTRVAHLERALADAMYRLSYVRAEQVAMESRLGAPAPAALPAEREARAAAGGEPAVAPAAPLPGPTPEAAAVPAPEAAREPVAAPRPEEASPPVPEPVAPSAPVAASEPVAASKPAAAPEPVAAPEPGAIPEPVAAPGTAVAPEIAAPPTPEAIAARAPLPEPSSPSSAAPATARFDWERWVGVRGAAALGACVLVIAGLYFFKYSIENELIPPPMRVALGVLVGAGGLGASELMLRRSFTVLANWLAGAGVAILYTAFWFAHQLGLLPGVAAFGAMIVVTATCGFLAVRHDAMVIALLGLLGGFSTPVALSTGEDHPFGLFGYLLLLDGALLALAHRKRWPVLGALSLAGTALYQAAWIGERMGAGRLALGMGILVAFGALYAVATPAAQKDEGAAFRLTRAGTVLLPFAFGIYFGARSDLGDRIYPLGIMLVIVSAGASWVGRARAVPWASPAAAVAGTTVLGVWLVVHRYAAIAWEAALVPVALAAVFHAFVELSVWRPRPDSSGTAASRAAALAGMGTLFVLVAAACAPSIVDPWPWLAGWALLAALTVRQSLLPGGGGLRLGLGILVACGFICAHALHVDQQAFPAAAFYLAAVIASTGLGLLSAGLAARGEARSIADEIAALVPLVTALYFASRGEIGSSLAPLAAAITLLAAGAAWVATRREEAGWTVPSASVGGFMVLGTWLAGHARAEVAWEASALVCVFAAVLPAFVEVGRHRGTPLSPAVSGWAVLTPVAGVLLLVGGGAASGSVSPWPWLVGWTVLGVMALREAGLPGRAPLHLALAVVLGAAFPVLQAVHGYDPAFPAPAVWLAAALVTAVAFLGGGLRHRDEQAARWAAHGAATLALMLAAGAQAGGPPPPAAVFYLDTLALAAVALIAAARLGAGGWALAAAGVAALAQTGWTLLHVPARAGTPGDLAAAGVALAAQGLSVALVATWPLIAGPRLRASRWAWRAAALAGPLWMAGLDHAFRSAFGSGAIGILPLALGALTFAVAMRARARLPEEVRQSALVWLLGVSLAAVSFAVPLQLENEWITVGWAIEGAALLALWRRFDHAGLKYTALAHLAVVALRLTLNPWVLAYHPRSDVPVLNWLAYTYWIPAAALLAGFFLLRDQEVPRRRAWEAAVYPKDHPALAMASAAAAVVVFFVWINLTIFDAFGTGRAIEVVFERLPARDLTLSLAWAVYALGLLGVGVARRSAALRWASLLLVIGTIGKVFLYDLSHLHDLYRVMSLVGLALSLILISLAYQRFVFGKRRDGVG